MHAGSCNDKHGGHHCGNCGSIGFCLTTYARSLSPAPTLVTGSSGSAPLTMATLARPEWLDDLLDPGPLRGHAGSQLLL